MRSLLAIVVSINLIILSPGLGCYSAAASVVGSSAVSAAAGTGAGGIGAAGASRTGNLSPVGLRLAPLQVGLGVSALPSSLPTINVRTNSSPSAVISESVLPAASARVGAVPVISRTAANWFVASNIIRTSDSAPKHIAGANDVEMHLENIGFKIGKSLFEVLEAFAVKRS